MAHSDTAIARLLLKKKMLTEPQFEIWFRAAQMKHSLRAIAKDYPVSWVTIFAWRKRATTLVEEVQDTMRLIEQERANQPVEPEEPEPRWDIAIDRETLELVDDTTMRRAIQRS